MLGALIVASESVNSAFDENESEFRSSVLTEAVDMLADADCLFDEVVEIFRDLRSHSFFLENTKNLGAGDFLDLRNTLHISEMDADLRRSESFFG